MNILIDVFVIAASVFGLWWGAVWVVEAATRIARRLGVSQLVIGLTVVAIGTSTPEFTVTLTAALQGFSDISVGNVVGSNIFNLAFILGAVALLHPLVTSRPLVYRDGLVMVGASAVVLVFLLDLTLDIWEGAILVGLLIAYIAWLILQRAEVDEVPSGEFHWYDVPRLMIGLALIAGSGYFLVDAASNVARTFGISDWVIGMTIVAAGTSLPEAATSLVAAISKRHGISAGNLVGSTVFNLLGVLGLAGLVRPLHVDDQAIVSMLAQVVLTLLVVWVMRSDWVVSRLEGAALVLFGAAQWIFDFWRQG